MRLQCYLVVQFIIYTSHTLVLYHNNFILNDTSFIFISGKIRNGESRVTDKHPVKLGTSDRLFIGKSHTLLLVGDREGTDWQEAKSPRSCNNQRRKRGGGRGACIKGGPIHEKRCI